MLWSVGVSALLPVAATAAICPAFQSGDLLKVTGRPAIYAVDSNGKVLYFPSGDEFKSWNTGETYGGYTAVDQACYDSLPVPAMAPMGVNFRPGSFIVKRASSDQLYVVEPGNKLAKITAAAADALYGTTRKTFTVADVFWTNYPSANRGADITEAKVHPGMLVSNADKTWYVDDNSTLHEVTPSGMTANRFKAAFVRPVTSAMITGLSTGDTYSALVPALSDRTQTGGASSTIPPTGGGALSVALDATNPAGGNLADSTALNPVLKVSLRAGSADVKVTGLTVTKSGFLANTAVSGIEVVDSSGLRHGSVASSINADNQVTLIFSGDPIVVRANGSEVATVRVNLGSVITNGTLRFSLASASAVQTEGNGSVSGSFPVTGNEFIVYDGGNAVAAVKLDTVQVHNNATLNVDDVNQQDLAKFTLQETTSKEKVLVKEWTLYNNGTAADSDLKDFQLVAQDSTVLSTAQQVNKNIRFVLATPYEIDKGLTKTFTVRGKIINGAARTIQLVTYNNYDVVVTGQTTGANLLPAVGSTDTTYPIGDATNNNKVTVGSGTTSFNKDTTSPTAAITPGSSNVVLAKYYAKPTGENMELRTIAMGVVTGTASVFTGSLTVRVNGASVAVLTPTDIANHATTLTSVTLSTYPTLVAGQNNYVTVEGNISSSATNGATTTVYMDLTQVRRLITNDIMDPGVGIVASNQLTIQAAALRVTNLALPVAQSVVAGTSNKELANIELNAGVVSSGEDVKVTSIIISQTKTAGAVTDFGNLVLYDAAGNALPTTGSTSNGAASTTFTFVSPVIVPKTGSVVLKLRGDVLAGSGAHTFAVDDADNHVASVGKDTGNEIDETAGSGVGQGMTVVSSGYLTLSMVSGVGGSPSTDQLVTPGQTNVAVFAFKLTAQNEPIKLTTLRLMASGTAWSSVNNLTNIRLYRNSETNSFASATQMSTGPGTNTSTVFTWTATDNLLPDAVQPGTSVTIYVKADIGVANQVKLGEGFQFGISSTSTTNIVAKGASSNATLDNNNTTVLSGAPLLATGLTYIAPFQVLATADAPTAGSSATQAIIAGTQLARIKIMNNGSSKVTISGIQFTDSGSHTGTTTSYTLKYSSQNSTDYTANTASSTAWASGGAGDSVNFSNLGAHSGTFDIDGGSYRFVTVSIQGLGPTSAGTSGDNWQLSIASLGHITYSVAESDLGYDGNLSGGLAGSISSLKADGKPQMGTLVKS